MPSPEQETSAPRTLPALLENFWRAVILTSSPKKKKQLVAATLALVVVIGLVDFLAGFELSLLVFYIFPICLAVAAVGWRFGAATAVISVVCWLAGDFAAGARYSNAMVPVWNALFAVGTYFLVVWLFKTVIDLHREMEARVKIRTADLLEVIQERERLENALLETGERERSTIGRELHDDLGQHLTGTAFASLVLSEKLHAKHLDEAADALKLVDLLEEGIEKTRRLSRGLLQSGIKADGLVPALQEFSVEVSDQYHIFCQLHSEFAPRFSADEIATHLFRIVQEAVRNAIQHGKSSRVVIGLSAADVLRLDVRDFGSGLPHPRGKGLGLSIMAHRAEIIGGRLEVANHPDGGAHVTCVLPLASLAHEQR